MVPESDGLAQAGATAANRKPYMPMKRILTIPALFVALSGLATADPRRFYRVELLP